MSEEYYHQLDWNDEADLETKVKALYNTHNWLTHEMSIGRVPNNKKELQEDIVASEKRVSTPLSIAFVKMVEKGEIDEVTASENADMFIAWSETGSYNINDYRTHNGKLYKCLQAHTSQADWTPDVSPALWKECGVSENGIMEWSQPISSADAYMLNDEVMHGENVWISDYDNNVWEPGVFGWHIKEETEEETPEIPEVPQNPSGDTL